MRKKALMLCVMGMALTAAAQKENGGITSEMLVDIRKEQKAEHSTKALMNAIAGNSIDDLTRSHTRSGAIDTYFSVDFFTLHVQIFGPTGV